MTSAAKKQIEVWAAWPKSGHPQFVGSLHVNLSRGKEIFSFEYSAEWLKSPYGQSLDPSLGLFRGRQYAPEGKENFGIFLDSAPDRWGRMLMQRREAQLARLERRTEKKLQESDFLLGVYDGHRMGALRFRDHPHGPFLDDNPTLASPPWTSLRELQHASIELEKDDAEMNPHYAQWLQMLIAPGSSLGGARPKASVIDEQNHLWIAKFPSRHDDIDIGAWEMIAHQLAENCGIATPAAECRKFSGPHHTYLSKRFDRTEAGDRIHFASVMTLLQRSDGDDATKGASYLELAEFIQQQGAQPKQDLRELWRRIVFFMCISNVDDHLRNHGFLLCPEGWALAPAYDMNPVASGDGLKLNVSETDNSQDLELAREVAPYFRLKKKDADLLISEVIQSVRNWNSLAKALGISTSQRDRMSRAFRLAEL